MNKNDARKLDHKTLTEVRRRAVKRIKSGQSPEKVAEVLNVSGVNVYGWLARFREKGWSGLDAKKREGRPNKLNGKALKWIFETVSIKNPLQLKFPFALWTAKMIGQLIEKRFYIKLSKASVCRLLKQLGLTPQRPVWKAYQQKPEAVRNWLKKSTLKFLPLQKR